MWEDNREGQVLGKNVDEVGAEIENAVQVETESAVEVEVEIKDVGAVVEAERGDAVEVETEIVGVEVGAETKVVEAEVEVVAKVLVLSLHGPVNQSRLHQIGK